MVTVSGTHTEATRVTPSGKLAKRNQRPTVTGALVLDFVSPQAHARTATGGKGAGLAALAQAGFPVPAGFCVTVSALTGFLDAAGIGAEVARIAGKIDYDSREQLGALTAQIRDLIQSAPMPA